MIAWFEPARRHVAEIVLFLVMLAVAAVSATFADDLPALILPDGREILEDEGIVCLPVTLSEPSDLPVSVRVTTVTPDELLAAVPHEDYIPLDGRLDFPPGRTEQEVCIRILDDEVDELAGYFSLALSEPVNAALNLATAEYFIRDNDGPAFLRIHQWYIQPEIVPGEVLTYTYQVWSDRVVEDPGRTVRFDVAIDPPAAIASLEVVVPPFDPTPLVQTSCGPFVAGALSCTIRDLDTEDSVHFILRLTTAADFSGALNATAGVTGIRGTTNTNPQSAVGPQTVLVASQVWSTYAPVLYGVYDYTLTGLQVRNRGPGGVLITLPSGPRHYFEPGTDEWWFPVGGGGQVVNAVSSSGPCKEATYLGGNNYNIAIDFAAGEIRHLNFICLDASRPPDGSAWFLYYNLVPVDEP